jgi:shikimate dehydrogenase
VTEPRLFGVVGDPIAHSRSPAMHAAAFAALGLPHRYVPLRVRAGDLAVALVGARALGFCGLNVTVPHKRAALDHLDTLSDTARRVGAVNTIVVTADALHGDNTDVVGFARAWAELGTPIPQRAVVFGAGGAGRAVIEALHAHLRVPAVAWVSREPAATDTASWPGVQVHGWDTLEAACAGAELLVNATTVGMASGPAEFPRPWPDRAWPTAARAIDVVVGPTSGWLERLAAAGVPGRDGRSMLLWQGVAALERWLGIEVPAPAVVAMRGVLDARAGAS